MNLLKKIIGNLLTIIFLYGCSGPGFIVNGAINANNKKMDKIVIGESKDSALNRLVFPTIIFTEAFWPNKNNIIISPVGSDLILQEDKRYETWFFYSKYKKNDGKATRDETTPYIFLNNKYFGKGWQIRDSIERVSR